MAREISSAVASATASNHVEPVLLCDLEFDDLQYVHSRLGNITYNGNTYIGVGNAVTLDSSRESEVLGPAPITATASGLSAALLRNARMAETYRAPITFRMAYRQSDGTLYDDPVIVWKGTIQRCDISFGPDSSITITADHDVSVLSKSHGGRYTDEDQQNRYSGDVAFSYVHDVPHQKLIVGRRSVDHRHRPRP